MTTLEMAKQCLIDHDLERAEQFCRDMLDDDPSNAEAWHLFGMTYAQQGCLDEAVTYFRKATESDTDGSLYPYNLALAYKMQGDLDRAASAYQVAIDRKDDFLEARSNLGNVLIEQRKNLEAVQCFRELVDRFPDSSDSHFNLANTLLEIGRHHDAVTHYRRALELDPKHSTARENLGRAYTDAEQIEEARETWQNWLEHEPDNDLAQHMLAAVTGTDVPDRCTDDCIRQEFNADFASTFDRQLSRLDYQSPTLIGKALEAVEQPLEALDILDAGCGTGLCGPIVRPMASHLVGVDLSAAMLDEARKRDVYDEPIECEITEFMESNPRSFDLIISSDTLCYFGDLSEVLTAAARSLKENGILVFTVEKEESDFPEQEPQSYRLQPHGRYCHSEDYVKTILAAAGLLVQDVTTAIQRTEGGTPVEGLVVTAKRVSETETLSQDSRSERDS